MIIVSDTGPLNYLILISHVDILSDLYQGVAIPQRVQAELLSPRAPDAVRTWVQHPPTWLAVMEAGSTDLKFHKDMHAGEREAITLALRLGVQLLLVDDARAVIEANRYGLETIGTLGLLRQAHHEGLLDIREALNKLEKTSFRSTAKLIERMLQDL